MKRALFGVYLAGAVLMWFAAPVWGDEAAQPKMSNIEQASVEAPAENPDEMPVVTPAAEPTAVAEPGIHIEDAVVCQEVVDRLPIGSGDVFDKGAGKIFCFTRVVGLDGGGDIIHNWYYKGTLKSTTKLSVGSGNWRTWSSKSINPEFTGEWMVEVLTEDGKPLQSILFFVQ